jgi:K+/H+ antiporter YhaU regulatory subunit KhtT
MSILKNKELVVLGEGVDLFTRAVPSALAGRSLAESEIGARTGLHVVGLKNGGEVRTDLAPSTDLPGGCELVMIGSDEQMKTFVDVFEE